MGLTSTQIGIIIATCSGVAIIASILLLLIYPGLNCLLFPRQRRHTPKPQLENPMNNPSQRHPCPSTASVCGVVEKYGELYITPDRKPVCVGIDTITRMLVASNLPVHTVRVRLDAASAMEQGCAPRVSLHSPRAMSLMQSGQSDEIVPVGLAVTCSFARSAADVCDLAGEESAMGEKVGAAGHCEERFGGDLGSLGRMPVLTVGDGEEVEKDMHTAVIPQSPPDFGTGKGMAVLYGPYVSFPRQTLKLG